MILKPPNLERYASSADYERGQAVGAEWAAANIFPDAEKAPFIPGHEHAKYNRGVLDAIVAELGRLAEELSGPASKIASE